ncbi:MAG: rhodanese-related sulfurtransferase [Chlamydiales bacterium]|nr:rhodanese-related sulfurtransferase [Chlamydiales bacterium]NCF70106.1 rhodanese-related sulfurtransferase [Chlamydiales bacterium]
MSDQQENQYLVLAYYYFTDVDDPQRFVKDHKRFIKDLDLSCRVYISEDGINGQLSAQKDDALKYISWLKAYPGFEKVEFKLHEYHENVFPRQTVKYKKQLVALDKSVNAKASKGHVSPKEWREMMESDEPYFMIDVRNDYESKIGHFEGAECPDLRQFRDFREYAQNLKTTKPPENTKVMMYCTGGIRCELYSEVLREQGYNDVYQLDGGVIKYGLEEQGKHWKGKLFVFDDRLSVGVNEDDEDVISTCEFCSTKSDRYYNCANMECNKLFLACPSCLEKVEGCCCQECGHSDKKRPLSEQKKGKPFRRYHLIKKELPSQV